MLSTATQWPRTQFSTSNTSFLGSITSSNIQDLDCYWTKTMYRSRTQFVHKLYIFQIGLTDGFSAFLRVFIASYNLSANDFHDTNWGIFQYVTLINWILADFNYLANMFFITLLSLERYLGISSAIQLRPRETSRKKSVCLRIRFLNLLVIYYSYHVVI